MIVHLDFETRSAVDIVMEGAYKYAMSPTTSTLCLGVGIDNGEVRALDTRKPLDQDVIASFNKLIAGGAVFKAFNVNFERQIWRHVFLRENPMLKDIPILQWSCVAAKAMACGLPASLDSVAKYITPDYRKDKGGSLLINKLCKPQRVVSPGTELAFLDDDKLHADLMAYCRQDVEVERQIDHALPDLIDYEKKIFALDQFINDRGVAIDTRSVNEARKIIAFETERREALLTEATNGQLTDVRKIGEIKKYLTAAGHTFESLNKKAVADAVKTVEGDALMVLKLRQELGQSSLAKYDALARCVCPDGRLHGALMYHAAHTGRWGGRLVQPQNLPRGEVANTHLLDISFKDMDMLELVADPLKVLSSAVRNMFVADEQETLIMADYAAIEARVLMWYAKCKTGVDIFTRQDAGDKDADIYVAMAREIYGDKTITKKDKAKRQLGKTAVLGLGYGMGKDKFLLTCQQAGMPVDAGLAERAVRTFRTMFKEVPALWRRLEDEAMRTMGGFYRNDKYRDFLCFRLPSGRELRYYKAKVEAGEIKYLSKEAGSKDLVWRGTYSGRLCENAVQAMARDVMADAMLNLHRAGFKIVLTVHDEIVVTVPKKDADSRRLALERIMKTAPAWATGLPLNVESEICTKYKK